MTDREYMENKVRHAFNKGYDLGFKDGKEKAKSQQPCDDAISRQREKNISKGFEDFMINSLRKQAESEE